MGGVGFEGVRARLDGRRGAADVRRMGVLAVQSIAPELQAAEWFIEADMSKYISYIVATLNHDRSLSRLLNPYDKIHTLMHRYTEEQTASGIRLV